MSQRRHTHLLGSIGLVLVLCLVLPATALAAGKPTSTPAPPPTPKPTAPAPTSVPPATTVPTSPPATTAPTAPSAPPPTAVPTSPPATAAPSAPPATAAPAPADANIAPATPADANTAPAAPAGSDTTSPAAQPDNGATAPEGQPTDTGTPPEALPDDTFTLWHGVVREGGAYRRSAPSSSGEILEDLDPGTPIRVDAWVAGSMNYPDVITWAQVDPEDGGGYIFGGSLAGVLPPEVPPAPGNMQGFDGTWVDVNLTLDVVTAYQDGSPVKMMLASPGRPGYETDTGNFAVRTKLLSQEMTGPGYDVPNVPHVQYFVGAEALHGRYWTLPGVMGQTSADVGDNGTIQVADDPYADAGGVNGGVAFGVPSSHGCVGLDLDSATWLYTIAGVGTPVDVHYS